MIDRLPAYLAAGCLTLYWLWVLVKLVRLGMKLGKDPNAMPREPIGQMMRLLWYPCIGLLIASLWAACVPAGQRARWPESLRDAVTPLWQPQQLGISGFTLAAVATVLCIAGTAVTFICWRKMGRSWRIGIDPNEKLEIVSTGPYRYVRHPIYSLRMMINICTAIMVPSPLVIVAAAMDFLLLQVEARREERYMESKHGGEYARYKHAVGRFVPRHLASSR